MRLLCMIGLLGLGITAHAQDVLSGRILLQVNPGLQEPAGQADVFWLDGSGGTQTNELGIFRINRSQTSGKLVVSYVGYRSDTVETSDKQGFELTLLPEGTLREVVIEKRIRPTEISFLESIKIEKIGETELQKAACCNLAESFETQPGVDVAITDAISGARQIRMLGLSGIYNQITLENLPGLRGLSAVRGLEAVPGTWIEGMQLNKGAGSVVNGFESGTGQINLDVRKPHHTDTYYLNLFAGQGGRLEANTHLRYVFNDQLSTGLLLHAKYMGMENDRNGDGFLDMPMNRQFIALHRWNYHSHFFHGQAMVYGAWVQSAGGQAGAQLGSNNPDVWSLNEEQKQLSLYAKTGFISRENPSNSTAVLYKLDWFDQQATYGLKRYVPLGKSAYVNLIRQIGKLGTYHSLKYGASWQYDYVKEQVDDTTFQRSEHVVGAYTELSTKVDTRFSSVLGLRIDHSNYYGVFATPRLHIRYAFNDKLVYRLSAGRGHRTPFIFTDNPRIWASNRRFIIHSEDNGKPYGLNEEVIWNFGMSLTGEFKWNYRDAVLSADLYHTRFTDQIVMDFDKDPRELNIYSLKGHSYSNSVQVQLDYELLRKLDVRLAYRWYDVHVQQISGLLRMPYLSQHRAFINAAYEFRKKWKFDATVNWFDRQRIAHTESNPELYRLPSSSPAYFTLNGQITRSWTRGLETYLGFENLLDYRQNRPILSADDPFSDYFDASMVWGPVFGRNIYLGLRYRIPE